MGSDQDIWETVVKDVYTRMVRRMRMIESEMESTDNTELVNILHAKHSGLAEAKDMVDKALFQACEELAEKIDAEND